MDLECREWYVCSMKNLKAVIFDLNGVFIQSLKLSDRFRRDFQIDETVFLPALQEVMSHVRKPNANSVYSYWLPYFTKWGVTLNEVQFLEYWFSAEKENFEMVKMAEDLKQRGLKLFILSNNFRERADYYRQHFLFLNSIFQKIYYSWQTGFIKPDKQAFELILKENDLKASECLYFDDSQKNVDVAKEIGIEGYLFQGMEDVREKLSTTVS